MMMRIATGRALRGLVGRWSCGFGLLRFPLPDLGEKIKEGRVKKMYVREGDRVEEFQRIADVESDKQFTEITAPEQGVIKTLYYQEDQTCQVGDIFLEIENTDPTNDQSPSTHLEKQKEEPAPPTQQPSASSGEVLASATVRMWAREHSINLEQVKGTGKKNRVLKDDIIYFIENRKNQPIKPRMVLEQKPLSTATITTVKMDEAQQLKQKMASYSATIPHLYLQELFDVTDLTPIIEAAKLRKLNISLLSILLKALSMALTEHPKINSIYKVTSQFNFNKATQQSVLLPLYGGNGVSYGLIEDLQSLSIVGIQNRLDVIGEGETSAEKIKDLVAKATICLSDIGEVKAMALNPSILGEMICHASIGEVREVAVSSKGKVVKRQQVSVVLGGDHRVMDGASCARFSKAWKDYSENPTTAFLTMI